MALLKIKLPRGVKYSRLIETIFNQQFGLPIVPLSKMLTPSQLRIITQTSNIKSFLITSPTIHGVELPTGAIFIHPDPVFKRLRASQRGYLKKLAI